MDPVILVHSDDETGHILELNLNLYLGVSIIPMPRAEKAIELLKTLPKAALIISFDKIGLEDSALTLYRHIQKHEKDIPLLSVGYVRLLDKKCEMIKEKTNWKETIKVAAQILGITPQDMASRVMPSFHPIPLKYFQNLSEVNCDVFVGINKKGQNKKQFIKRFRSGDKLVSEDIDRYFSKGVDELYVSKKDRLYFVRDVNNAIINKLKAKSDDPVENVEVSQSAFYGLREALETTGLTEQSIEMAQLTIGKIENVIQETPSLDELFKTLKDPEGNILFSNAITCAFVGHHVLENLMMGTKERQKIFTFVAFFHDIMLKDDRFGLITSNRQLNKLNLQPQEKKMVETHALDACNLLRDYPDVPIAAPIIIKQHHLALDGKGFVNLPTDRIHPLAQIFRVIEDYVLKLRESDANKATRLGIVSELKSKYTKHLYHDTCAVLEKLA